MSTVTVTDGYGVLWWSVWLSNLAVHSF